MVREYVNNLIRKDVDAPPSYTPKDSLTIAFVGHISSGKSSLVNAFITYQLDREDPLAICPVDSLRCTGTISEFTLNDQLDFRKKEDQEQIQQKLQECMTQLSSKNRLFSDNKTSSETNEYEKKESDILFPGLVHDELLKYDLCLIDTPGMGEKDARNDDQMASVLKQANIIIVTVKPDDLDAQRTSDLLTFVQHHSSGTVLIALTMCDTILKKKNEKLNLFDSSPQNSEIDHEKIADIIRKFTDMTAGLPVVAVSVKSRDSKLSLKDGLLKTILQLKKNGIPPILKLRQEIIRQISRNKCVPLNEYSESWKQYKSRNQVVLPLVGAGVAGLGAMTVVGGGLVFLIPGFGTGAGAAAITSGLAELGVGFGMLAGVGTVLAITLGSGFVAGSIGGIATTIGERAIKSVTALAIEDPNIKVEVKKQKMSLKDKDQIDKYMKLSKGEMQDSDHPLWNNMKYFSKEYRDGEEQAESTFVEVDGTYYYVAGLFRQRKMTLMVRFVEVEWTDEDS